MSIAARITLFRTSAKRFIGADEGNIATIFAIAALPILGLVGAAIDYTRASAARSAMQSALDSTALMLSKDLASGTITTADVPAKAQTYFKALYTNKGASNVGVTGTYSAATAMGSTIQVTGLGSMTTEFLKVVGFPQLTIDASSTAAWGNARMRVAMALDNTGSMAADGKIGALQTASKNLIDQLSALAKAPGDVYISIVPFAKDVNFGNVNPPQPWIDPPWIDWTDWDAEAPDLASSSSKPSNWTSIGPGSNCPWSISNDGFTCLSGPGSTTVVSKIPSSGTYKGYICPGPDPSNSCYKYHFLINGCYDSVGSKPSITHAWHSNAHSTWSGCVTDRTQPYDTQNTAPAPATVATLFPAEQYYENGQSFCAQNSHPPLQPIVPLSYDWTGLKDAISAMQPTGGTDQPIGLAWAYQTLQPGSPMDAPAEDSNYTYTKAIILLSDGLNTEDRWPAYGDGSTQFSGQIDARQEKLCDNIKAAGVTIYTIQVNTGKPADPTSGVLQYCASSADKFYLLYSASQVISAFNSIGTSLSKLRVAR
jgi:Flp pilus assembly protein TadG